MILEYVEVLRDAGGVVNGAVLSGATQGILAAEAPHKLQDTGGNVDPNSPTLIQSLYRRFNLVRRKATSSRGAVDFEQISGIKNKFVEEIEELIVTEGIPNELILNFDETGTPIIPVGDYTMAKKGSKTVKIFKKRYVLHVII